MSDLASNGRHAGAPAAKDVFIRWLKFNFVGVLGAGVQLLVLWLLTKRLAVSVLPATAIAVEAAIIHNFVWHEQFTWKAHRLSPLARNRWVRFAKFNLSNGGVSLLGNIAIMWLLSGKLKMPVLAANLIAICLCALLNFYLSERHIFVSRTD